MMELRNHATELDLYYSKDGNRKQITKEEMYGWWGREGLILRLLAQIRGRYINIIVAFFNCSDRWLDRKRNVFLLI